MKTGDEFTSPSRLPRLITWANHLTRSFFYRIYTCASQQSKFFASVLLTLFLLSDVVDDGLSEQTAQSSTDVYDASLF